MLCDPTVLGLKGAGKNGQRTSFLKTPTSPATPIASLRTNLDLKMSVVVVFLERSHDWRLCRSAQGVAVTGADEVIGRDRIALLAELESSAVLQLGLSVLDDRALGERLEASVVDRCTASTPT